MKITVDYEKKNFFFFMMEKEIKIKNFDQDMRDDMVEDYNLVISNIKFLHLKALFCFISW